MIIDQLMAIKTKSDTILQSIKVSIDISQYFVYTLSLIANKSPLTLSIQQKLSKTPYNNSGKFVSTIIIFSFKKSFSDLSIFINEKDLTIKHQLLKMQIKLKLNQEHYFDIDIYICYVKNYYKSKALEYLQFHLCTNLLISFKIINKLFTKLERVYKDFHCQKHTIKKFGELKIDIRFFNIFYFEFIKLTTKFGFTKEMLLQKFMYQLFFYIQDQINFGLKYSENIKDLTTCCQKIYDQIIATNYI